MSTKKLPHRRNIIHFLSTFGGIKIMQKIKYYIFIFFLFSIFLNSHPSKAESASNYVYGFIDNGNFIEFGALYLDISSLLLKNIDKIVSSKSQTSTPNGRIYVQIPPTEMSNYFSFSLNQVFQVYAEAKLLGEYKIKCIIIVNDQTGRKTEIFAQLDGKKPVSAEVPVIARILNNKDKKPLYNIMTKEIPTDIEKNKIEKILYDKINYAKMNIIKKYFSKVEFEQFEYKTDYQCFKIKANNEESENVLVNATWKYAGNLFALETDLYLTNTFIISKDKIIDVEPLEMSFEHNYKIPKIIWGIKFDDDNNVKWVINYDVWECSINKIVELNGEKFKELSERRLCDIYGET
jgi:hypothetical protein